MFAALVLALRAGGCRVSEPARTTSAACDAAVLPPDGGAARMDVPTVVCLAPGGPCMRVGSACEGVWYPGPLPTPWWIGAPAGACVESSAHASREAYDDCGPPAGGESCEVPAPGAVVCGLCNTYNGRCRWTQTCLKMSDCPATMGCVSGGIPGDLDPNVEPQGALCQKLCATSADCILCDLECSPWGVCRPRVPGADQPCTSDCECFFGSCSGGRCYPQSGAVGLGLCGPGGDCACVGGTCDERMCCVLADGTVATTMSEACQPDGGVP